VKLPDGWRCIICGASVSRFELHDCKPVPIAKYEEAQAEIERLRSIMLDVADRKLPPSETVAIDALRRAALCHVGDELNDTKGTK
jgi:hypothetical protein